MPRSTPGKLKVLVACEFSGVVREAFLREGHDAWSCDLRQGECPTNGRHIQGDVRELLKSQWDLVIAHPPCTYLTKAGSFQYGRRKNFEEKMARAALFFKECLSANAPRVCVENPVIFRRAIDLIGQDYSQIIQPWQFGHPTTKATCLWLKGLPKLLPTKIVEPGKNLIHTMPPSKFRSKERSRTFWGIAKAMAMQWGGVDASLLF